jgi:hypothetical protein
MSLIVFPGAQMHCDCGALLAPHPEAARRMGMASMLASAGSCQCGALVLREPHQLVRSGGREPVCECCQEAGALTRIEHKPGAWSQWCLSCFEERESLIAERFRAAQGLSE